LNSRCATEPPEIFAEQVPEPLDDSATKIGYVILVPALPPAMQTQLHPRDAPTAMPIAELRYRTCNRPNHRPPSDQRSPARKPAD
jgi:hypothetical protein